MTAYYNENDPYNVQWLRNLIAAGIIAPGEVDARSIATVHSDDLRGYEQCHFFAGIGGWSFALRRAGWSDARPVWTGSCPCQPFSVAGRHGGFEDPRHLWPVWRGLIAQRRPATIFGEQVASAARWITLVHGDLEALGYAVGCLPIEAACAGADHLRDRYWFVANANGERPQVAVGESGDAGAQCASTAGVGVRVLADPPGIGWGEGWTEPELRRWGPAAAVWSIDGCQIIECPDGKWRRLPPPRVRWLGTRLPARIPRVRAFGNAIDPRPAAQFIAAYMEYQP